MKKLIVQLSFTPPNEMDQESLKQFKLDITTEVQNICLNYIRKHQMITDGIVKWEEDN